MIRAAAREKLDKRLNVLDTIARSGKSKDGDRIAAVRALADIGLNESMAVTDVRKALEETGAVIRQRLPEDDAELLIEAIRPIWLRL